jgi:alanyl-tRNA synthetase
MVNVYTIGPRDATAEDPKFGENFSIEFCGGPHVENTRELKGPEGTWTFKIQKEEAVAQGIRRIKAILE